MIKTGIIGIGRMGRIHLENICTQLSAVEVIAVMNPGEEGQQFAGKWGVPLITDDADLVIKHPDIDAVIISSATPFHADYAIAAAKEGKAIFCEKPLDLHPEKVKKVLDIIEQYKVPFMLAFNQRFDPHFNEVKEFISSGKLGDLNAVHIISRDPAPPPLNYLLSSGGLFLDMTIHDFDMARHLVESEVKEVFAKGSARNYPDIDRIGDIDTGYVWLTFENGVTVMIENSRATSYGYDQRIEAFGTKGMIKTENPLKTTNQILDAQGVHLSCNQDFFMDRYEKSYLLELKAFFHALAHRLPMPVTGIDGLKAMEIAMAAQKSRVENRPVRL
jgi:myo-inositol 2-dehydrogenase/D-chiro-inositol 1-dehydrogenase